jgi:tetratricopeptide (TPR) repeat protein/O-antigen ligase
MSAFTGAAVRPRTDPTRVATRRASRSVTDSRLATIVIAIWTFGFVGFFGTNITTFHEEVRVVTFVLYGLPVAATALGAMYLRPMAVDAQLVALLVVYGCVAMLSVDQTASLETWFLVTLYACVLAIACRLRSRRLRNAVAIGVATAVAVWLVRTAMVWIASAAEWVSLGGGMPPLQAASGHLWLSTDAIPVVLILGVPFLSWITYRPGQNILLGTMLMASVVILPLSGARTAWVALAVAGFLLVTTSYDWSGTRAWHRAGAVTLVAGVGVAGVLLIATGALGTISGRTTIWETAIATIRSDLLTGTGPGTFSWVRLAFADPYTNRYGVYHAHDLVLQTLADGGVLLLSAGLGVLAILAWHLRGVFGAARPHRLAAAGLVGFALILMFDELTQLPALTAIALVLVGWLFGDVARTAASARRRWPPRWLAPLSFAAILVIAGPSVIAGSQARASAERGRAAAIAGDWVSARTAFEAAVDAWPSRSLYELSLGLVAASSGDARQAELHYERASHLSPGDPRPWGALAMYASGTDRIRLLEEASRLASSDPQYSYRLALAFDEGGNSAEAARALARAVTLDPQLLGTLSEGSDLHLTAGAVVAWIDDVYQDYGGRAPVSRDVIDDHVALVEESLEGDASPIFVALSELRSGDIRESERWADVAIGDHPYDPRSYSVAAAIARFACDPGEVARAEKLQSLLQRSFGRLYVSQAPLGNYPDHIYRELGLGDYQPPSVPRLPVRQEDWPAGLLPDADPC